MGRTKYIETPEKLKEYFLSYQKETKNNPFIVKVNECLEDERGNMVKLLRWVLKNYSTGTDIDGMFMWENPIGEEFDSMQLVDEYIKRNL